MARILLVDDEPKMCTILRRVLSEHGHEVEAVGTGAHAIEAVKRAAPDLVLMDVNLPGGMSGVETFVKLRDQDRTLPGVFITAHGSIPAAVDAMRAGAFDYITKPFENERLILTIAKALELRRLRQENVQLLEELKGRQVFPGIVGASRAIQNVLRVLPRVAATNATVLICGESGTGKELVARGIHRHSKRASGPFIALNSAAVPATLVESEFFGHERGAFTDARASRKGCFELADQGSLFLDEVGDLSLDAQAKLLRVLEDHQITRVGGQRPIEVNVRVIAATNRDLAARVKQGQFRDDLYYRLHVVPLDLPPLRRRKEDLPVLIDYFMERFNLELDLAVTGVSDEALARLLAHDWPGNIRELQNVIQRAMILSTKHVIQVESIGPFPPHHGAPDEAEVLTIGSTTLADVVERTTARIERRLIASTLARHRWGYAETAAALGINRKTLFNKIRSYGLAGHSQPDEEALP
jgi:DNA-binding NtrC family response regulator